MLNSLQQQYVDVCCCYCKKELEEKELEIEFYKEQEQVHQEEIQAYKRVEASICHDRTRYSIIY